MLHIAVRFKSRILVRYVPLGYNLELKLKIVHIRVRAQGLSFCEGCASSDLLLELKLETTIVRVKADLLGFMLGPITFGCDCILFAYWSLRSR